MPLPETHTLPLPDGRSLGWCRVGEPRGTPVLHCHGGLSCRLEIGFADALCRQLGIAWIAADRPGIGSSDACPGRRMTDWPADLAALADHLDIERFAVTGWSAGGPYALACGAMLPDRVITVSSIAGMAPLRSADDIRELGLAIDRLLFSLGPKRPGLCAAALSLARLAPVPLLRSSVRRMLGKGVDFSVLRRDTADDLTIALAESLRGGTSGTVLDYCLLAGDWGFEPADVIVPAMIWHGTADDLLPCEHAARLFTDIPTAIMEPRKDMGHFLLQRCLGDILAGLA